MEEQNNMGNLVDTNNQEVPGAEQTGNEVGEDTSQSETLQNDGKGSENQQNIEEDAFLKIRYNHEDMTLSREDTKKYAQLGKLYSESGLDIGTVKPIFSKLDYIAALKGTTPEALIDSIIENDEAQYRQGLIEKFGEYSEEFDILMQSYREGQKEKYNKILQDRAVAEQNSNQAKIESNNSRLANEFIVLQKEFPELTDIASVPKEVMERAVKENKDLMSCFLLHKYSEEKKINAANKTAEEAQKASTGSGSSADFTTDNAFNAFLRGFNS